MQVNLKKLLEAYGIIPGQTIIDDKGNKHQVKEDGTLDSGKNLFNVPFEESIKLSEFMNSEYTLGIYCDNKTLCNKLCKALHYNAIPYKEPIVFLNDTYSCCAPEYAEKHGIKVFKNVEIDEVPKTCGMINCADCPAHKMCYKIGYHSEYNRPLKDAFYDIYEDKIIVELLLRRLDK